MAITTRIQLYGDVPFNPNSAHIRLFSSTAEQSAYFNSRSAAPLTAYLTQRLESPLIAEGPLSTFKNINYIGIYNLNQWYYCYVNGIEYVNDNTTKIYFDIDPFQTWMMNKNIKSAYVEREHVNDDAIGRNLVPENLNTGDYTSTAVPVSQYFSEMKAVLLATEVAVGDLPESAASKVNNILVPGVRLETTDAETLAGTLSDYTKNGKSSAIMDIFMSPTFCTWRSTGVDEMVLSVPRPNSLDGYTPKNNKLYTYPYMFCLATNNLGETSILKWELSQDTSDITIKINGIVGTKPTIFAYPYGYKNVTDCYTDGLTLTNFPQCAWINDSYANWKGQQQQTIVGDVVKVAAGAVVGGITGGVAGAVTGAGIGAINSAAGRMTSDIQHEVVPSSVSGQLKNNSLNIAQGNNGFTYYRMSIRNDIAQMIDNYFEVYGYAVNKMKVPNITGRPAWNYVKCSNAVVSGNMPSWAIQRWENALNSGVTFWHTNDVGNYSLNNH